MTHYFDKPQKSTYLGFGERPVILVVDLMKGGSMGGLPERAVRNTRILLQEARKKNVPIGYTVLAYRSDLKDYPPNKLASMKLVMGTESVKVMDEVAPGPEDFVIIKKTNSPFIGTNLLLLLTLMQADTIIVTGRHTSGCIRATAADAFSYGYRTIIPEECVGDGKGLMPHKANLCDLHIRGADVLTLREVLEDLGRL